MTAWWKVPLGLAVAVLLGGAPSAAEFFEQPGSLQSQRLSECWFSVVLPIGTGEPDVSANVVLDTAAAIARRNGAVSVQGGYSREEYVNDVAALHAIEARNGNRVRNLLLSRGVASEAIVLSGFVYHSFPRQSGALVRVCAPGRNIDNGWRERPVDPARMVRVSVGSTLLFVPIVNFGAYFWNDIPIGEAHYDESLGRQFYLDRADDPSTFAEAQSRCVQSDVDSPCRRRIDVVVRPASGWPPPDAPPQVPDVGRRAFLRQVPLTRRWIEHAQVVASMQCVLALPPFPIASPNTTDGLLGCSARLRVVPDQVDASVFFTAMDEAEAQAIVTRARRDLSRFAAAQPGR